MEYINQELNSMLQSSCLGDPEGFKPCVSVIVPVYNTEKFLNKCLDSLINQTLKDIEIIIVNDGSTDNSYSIALSYAKKDSRVKLINQENKKQGAARNVGFKVATGEYIGYVDSDDWVDLNYYENLYIAAKKFNSDIAIATNVRIGNGKTKKRFNIEKECFVETLQDKIDISHQAVNPCPTNKIYCRAFLQNNDIKWPEGVYCEDKLFTIKAIYYANAVVTVPNVYYYYYRNLNSTVYSKAKDLINDKNRAKLEVLNFLKEKKADIRDCEFWAIKQEKRFCNIVYFREEISLHTRRFSVLGIHILSLKLKEDEVV